MSCRSQKNARQSTQVKALEFMQNRLAKMVLDVAKGKRTVHQDELPPCKTNKDGERCWTF